MGSYIALLAADFRPPFAHLPNLNSFLGPDTSSLYQLSPWRRLAMDQISRIRMRWAAGFFRRLIPTEMTRDGSFLSADQEIPMKVGMWTGLERDF